MISKNSDEKYDEAKKLKITIAELYRIGERLARYDIEKRQALEEEDYERAKLKKYQIQEYRTETYKQLQANNLLGYIEVDFFCFYLQVCFIFQDFSFTND